MSPGEDQGDAEKLSRLDDVVIETLLADRGTYVADAESTAAVARVRTCIASAKAAVGKRRLEIAKAGVAADRSKPRLVVSDAGARALRSARAADPALDRKMTMAARNEDAGFEADEAGIEEDLAELDAWEDGDGKA